MDPLSVDLYLDTLNHSLRRQTSRIIGEVMGLQLYPGRSYLFFSLKDKDSGSILRCMMWKTDYTLSGVELTDGVEVIISGVPEIYKPSGSLTFKPKTVELVGEGALKMAYDKLRLQLEREGVFAPERKRILPAFPRTIGVVTSRDGAVIHDFMTNLARCGYKIELVHTRVEGQLATAELLASIQTFRMRQIDVLVVIRGGGSLESLLPFNNEALVREIASFPVPVIAGIGHDKDVPLVALAADVMVSTPTAVTALLNDSWNNARHIVALTERQLFTQFRSTLEQTRREVVLASRDIREGFQSVFTAFRDLEYGLQSARVQIQSALGTLKSDIQHYAATLAIHDPLRQLRLGYSIIRSHGKVVRSVADVKNGDPAEIRLADGTVGAEITHIQKD